MNTNIMSPDETKNNMPHNNKLLTDYLLKNDINRAGLARKMNVSNTSVYQYAGSPSLQMSILWKASIALNHNFVAELGELLPVKHKTGNEIQLEEEIKALEARIEKLNLELSVYKDVISKFKP